MSTTDLVRCPTCPTIFLYEAPQAVPMVEGTTWSDGFCDVRPYRLEELAPVHRCARCNRWHWIDDLRRLFAVSLSTESIPRVDAMTPLAAEDLVEAIAQGWPPRREQKLRTQLLWLQNHPRRVDPQSETITAEIMENLERLSDIVDNGADALFAAEIHRELGDFPRARALIPAATHISPHRAAAISARLESRSIAPFPLLRDEARC